MNVIPIRTRFANRVAAYDKALAENIPDRKERVQAIVDLQAFLEVTVLPDEDAAEWDADDLRLFWDEFVAQSGEEGGEERFINMLLALDMLKDDSVLLKA